MEFRKLRADEIDVRVNQVRENGVSLLLYKDARVDQNILDETVGAENWQRSHEVVNGNLFCNVGIWFDRRSDGYGEWVWKQDVGVESYTEKEKGQASDAFKRACFNWGIGRELYTAPFIWVNAGKGVNIEQSKGKTTTKDVFKVKTIEYENGSIVSLEIQNMKKPYNGKVVYKLGNSDNEVMPVETKEDSEQKSQEESNKITDTEAEVLLNLIAEKGWDEKQIFPNGVKNLTPEQYVEALDKLGLKK